MTQFGPLVWPLATLVIALIFRRDLGHALGRIGQVKYHDLELTFRDDLRQAEQLARSIPPPAAKGPVVLELDSAEGTPLVGRLIVSPSTSDKPLERTDSPADLAMRSPREAVDAAWGMVIRTQSCLSPNPKLAALVGLLRDLRDRAVCLDLPPPSSEDARRFVDLALRVANRIGELG